MNAAQKFRILLWPRANANGQFPIKCCIAFSGKRRYYNTGIECTKKDWECSTSRLKPKNRAKDNEILNALETRAEKILRDWQKDNIAFSIAAFEEAMFSVSASKKMPTLAEIMHEAAERYEQKGQVSSSVIRNVMRNIIAQELPNETPATVTADHIQRLISKMKAAGMKPNTLSTYMAVLRTSCKPYATKGNMKIEVLNSMIHGKERAEKHAITREEMRLFENYDKPLPHRSRFYLDLFIFSFYVRGMNMADIARLRPENIQGNILTYARKKTGSRFKIMLLPPALRILEKYTQHGAHYLLPILKPGLTERQAKDKVDDNTCAANQVIRAIAADLGLPERKRLISFYTARHTYATTLKRQGVDVGVISELIGHSDVATTQVYLDAFEETTLHQADLLLMQ